MSNEKKKRMEEKKRQSVPYDSVFLLLVVDNIWPICCEQMHKKRNLLAKDKSILASLQIHIDHLILAVRVKIMYNYIYIN